MQRGADLNLFIKQIAYNFIKNDRNIMGSGIHFESAENAPHKVSTHTYIYIKVQLTNSEDPVYGIFGILTDITERIKAES